MDGRACRRAEIGGPGRQQRGDVVGSGQQRPGGGAQGAVSGHVRQRESSASALSVERQRWPVGVSLLVRRREGAPGCAGLPAMACPRRGRETTLIQAAPSVSIRTGSSEDEQWTTAANTGWVPASAMLTAEVSVTGQSAGKTVGTRPARCPRVARAPVVGQRQLAKRVGIRAIDSTRSASRGEGRRRLEDVRFQERVDRQLRRRLAQPGQRARSWPAGQRARGASGARVVRVETPAWHRPGSRLDGATADRATATSPVPRLSLAADGGRAWSQTSFEHDR